MRRTTATGSATTSANGIFQSNGTMTLTTAVATSTAIGVTVGNGTATITRTTHHLGGSKAAFAFDGAVKLGNSATYFAQDIASVWRQWHSAASPALAAAAHVREGVSNLGVAGTLDVEAEAGGGALAIGQPISIG